MDIIIQSIITKLNSFRFHDHQGKILTLFEIYKYNSYLDEFFIFSFFQTP